MPFQIGVGRAAGSGSTALGAGLTRSFLALVAGTMGAAALRANAAPLLASDPNYFPIGVFSQPANAQGTTSFAGWKLRGINTLVGYEEQDSNGPGTPTVSVSQWQTAAKSAGLYTIRTPNGSTPQAWAADAATATSQGLIAWDQPDEPENAGVSPSSTQASYTAWKSVANALPVFQNFDGSKVLGVQGGVSAATYKQYMAASDWVGQDIYPVTGFGSPSNLTWVGQATAATAQLSNKPTFAFIETSNQRLFVNQNPEWNFRGVTPGEMRTEIWDALIHGAKGIMYFPQSFNGFRYDATPLDVSQEMTRQNGLISSVASVLNSDAKTSITRFSLGASGLEAMVKNVNGADYLFVLNTTGNAISAATIGADWSASMSSLTVLGESRSISSFTTDGTTGLTDFTDQFDPFALHIYSTSSALSAAADAALVTVVPEPASIGLGILAIALLSRRRTRRRCDISPANGQGA